MPTKKIQAMYSWMNWNYIGLASGILGIVITFYNINEYWKEIRKAERESN